MRLQEGGGGGGVGGRMSGDIPNSDNTKCNSSGRGRNGDKNLIVERDDESNEGKALMTSTEAQNI